MIGALNRVRSIIQPCLILFVCLLSFAHAAERPNILFIAIDDLRPELGCYGSDIAISPHIDQLAANGVRFDSAHCQLAVCNPSRVSMLTGLRPDSTHVWTLDVRFRETIPDAVTLPQHFKQSGYETIGYGKIFHNPWPDDISWSEPHAWPKDSKLWSKEAKQDLKKFKAKLKAEGRLQKAINRLRATATESVDIPDGEHIDGAIAGQAIEAMKRFAKQDKPFFLAAGFVRPHLPFVVPTQYWDLYNREKIPLAKNPKMPENTPPFAMNTMYELRDYFDYLGTPEPREGSLTEAQQRELKHGYLASVSFIDAQVGRILEELKSQELDKNTIVVLWSDHGWKLGEHNSWCKQTNYEIDTRVPLIIYDPRAKGNGKATKALVELVDIYPTLCDLAEIEVPEQLEGVSLKPILEKPNTILKKGAVSQFLRRQKDRELMGYAYRTDRWRYIEWIDRKSGKTVSRELFDHSTGPTESINLAKKQEHTKLKQRLGKALRAMLPQPLAVDKTPQKAGAKTVAPASPHIVVIMGDDWSWPHASILGDKTVKTPHFDRIAREGVLFQNAFVSSPSCTPSRFAFATGQYHWRLEEGANLGGSLKKNVAAYPDLLAEVGFRTGYCRKGAGPSRHTYRGTDPFGERFKDFADFFDQRKDDQPFCFWYGAGEPHRPYDWKASLTSDLDLDSIEVPPYLPDNETTRTDLGDYYLKVQKLDFFAGRILETLEKAGELENTIVVMTGDNGMPFPRAKATLFDSGTRVPLAIRWGAKVKGGREISDFVNLTDLAPTFLEATGLAVPDAMTGKSLLATLTSEASGQVEEDRNHVLTGMERHVYPHPSRAIRTQDFLYIRNFAPEQWPLGKASGDELIFDFKKTPWPTQEGAFSHNADPGPTKQSMRLNDSSQNAQAFDRKPAEELYDLQKDPHQLTNLLATAEVEASVEMKRKELSTHLANELRASGDPRFAMPNHTTFKIHGWTIHLHDKLVSDHSRPTNRMLELLHGQLQRVVDVAPKPALKQLREIPIWINPPYEGKRGSAEYHPGAGWLSKNGRNPKMAKAIEITNVMNFPFENRRMPYVLLHELAHGYHDQVVEKGYGNAKIKATYERAKASGSYDEVARFNGNKTVKDKAYGMSTPMEYFAESTEAYFGKNDFFPFNRSELLEHDPKIHDLVRSLWNASPTH